MDIYATTASNAYESSWGTYCPGMFPPPPPEFTTCLGDLYSVAWLENRRAQCSLGVHVLWFEVRAESDRTQPCDQH